MTTLCFALPASTSYGAERNFSLRFSASGPHRNMDKSGCISSVKSSACSLSCRILLRNSVHICSNLHEFFPLYAIRAYLRSQGQSLGIHEPIILHPDLLSLFSRQRHRPPCRSPSGSGWHSPAAISPHRPCRCCPGCL